MTAEQHRLELMRDAFIANMSSIPIRQRLLQNRTLTFQQACDQARAQELAYKSFETFQGTTTCNITASDPLKKEPPEVAETHANQTSDEQSCSFAKSTVIFVENLIMQEIYVQLKLLHVTTVIELDIMLKYVERD